MKIASVEIAFAGFLAYQFDALLEIYQQHLEDWDGEFFPYIWMSEVARAIVERRIPENEVKGILQLLDRELEFGREGAGNLVGVAFVENLPAPQANGQSIVKGLRALEAHYEVVFGV